MSVVTGSVLRVRRIFCLCQLFRGLNKHKVSSQKTFLSWKGSTQSILSSYGGTNGCGSGLCLRGSRVIDRVFVWRTGVTGDTCLRTIKLNWFEISPKRRRDFRDFKPDRNQIHSWPHDLLGENYRGNPLIDDGFFCK